MRIRINGPSNIEKFSAIKYAKAYRKDGNMGSDVELDRKTIMICMRTKMKMRKKSLKQSGAYTRTKVRYYEKKKYK